MNANRNIGADARIAAAAGDAPFGPRPAGWHAWGAVAVVIIIAVGAAVCSNSFQGIFVFDDDHNILKNPHVTRLDPDLLDKPGGAKIIERMGPFGKARLYVKKFVTMVEVKGLRPVVTTSLAINYDLASKDLEGEPDVWGFHLVNMIVHILAGLALFGVVRWTLITRTLHPRFASAATPLALAVALIWMVHPLHTGAVTYIIQRAESAMGMFFLVTMYCAVRSYAAPDWTRWLWCLGATASCLAGMWSKQVMAVAPVMVLMYDMVFITRPSLTRFRMGRVLSTVRAYKKWLLITYPLLIPGYVLYWLLRPVAVTYTRHWPLYIGLFATWIVPIMQLVGPGGVSMTTVHTDIAMRQRTRFQYATTQFQVILHYFGITYWPARLCQDYFWQATELTIPGFYLPMLAVLGLLALTGLMLWKRPALGYLGAFFFLVLSPSSTIVPLADIAFEHRLYLPAAALVVLAVVGGYWLLGYAERRLGSQPFTKRLALVLAMCAIVALIVGLVISVDIEPIASGRPAEEYEALSDLEAETGLASLVDWGQVGLAALLVAFAAVPLLAPGEGRSKLWRLSHITVVSVVVMVLISLTVVRNSTYHTEVKVWQEVLRVRPTNPRAHNNLGKALYFEIQALEKRGQFEEAEKIESPREHFAEAIQLEKDYADPYYNYGLIMAELPKKPQTRRKYQKDPQAYADFRRAAVDDAIRYYEEAIRLKPNFPQAYNNLAILLDHRGQETKDPEESRRLLTRAAYNFDKAVRWDPTYSFAHNNLAALLSRLSNKQHGLADDLERAGKPKEAQEHRKRAERQIKQAEAHLAMALRYNKYFPDVYFNLGLIRQQQAGNPDLARKIPDPAERRKYRAAKIDEAIKAFREAIRLKPQQVEARSRLASVLLAQKKYAEASAHYQALVKLNQNNLPAVRRLARLLATAPAPQLRNAHLAIQLAQRACMLTRNQDPRSFDVLGAAYAEAGQFDKAIENVRKAIDMATRAGRTQAAEAFKSRLRLYQANRPARLPAPVPTTAPAKAP